MPFVPKEIEGTAPTKPHFTVLTDESGLAMAIPPGATMFIVEDPTRMDKVFPLILLSVSRRRIVFACGCGNASCTRKYVYTLARGLGHHSSSEARTKRALASVKHGSGPGGATAPTAPSPPKGER